jgi:hypothetical protein
MPPGGTILAGRLTPAFQVTSYNAQNDGWGGGANTNGIWRQCLENAYGRVSLFELVGTRITAYWQWFISALGELCLGIAPSGCRAIQLNWHRDRTLIAPEIKRYPLGGVTSRDTCVN